MNRWKVQNVDYDYEWAADEPWLLKRMAHGERPWEATVSQPEFHSQAFATHAEAITYADKQARRTA